MKPALLSPYEFWCHLDTILEIRRMTLKGFCRENDISYRTLTSQRTRQAYPKLEVLWQLSAALNISMDELSTKTIPLEEKSRILKIANACTLASEEDLFVVEKILGIQKSRDNPLPEEKTG